METIHLNIVNCFVGIGNPDSHWWINVVTNSPLQTTWEAANAKQQLTNWIIERCKQEEIHIDVFGVNDAAQLKFADESGGKWYPIDEY